MKPIYIYFSFRHFKKDNKMIVATVAYTDYEGKNLACERTDEVVPWGDSNYIKMIQSYGNALEFIYEKQEKFKSYGFDKVVIVTDNKILYNWILNNECKSFNVWFKAAAKPFRAGGEREITIDVGLGVLAPRDLAYKYCKLEMLDASLKMTSKGIKVLNKEETVEDTRLKEEEDYNNYAMISITDMLKDEVEDKVQAEGFM